MVASTGAATATAGALLLAPFADDLDQIAPRFDLDGGSQVRVLASPAEFYETLKTMIRGAKRRVFLSTLYIGKSERELIQVLREALASNPALHVSILTDALRGTREAPNPSSASLLVPLVAEFGADRVEVRMYHTPNLTGLRKKHIPKRINEGWGLQHMKLYGADDAILLSGANLSTDYFTNRQDRYHLFASAELTEFYWKLQRGVASLSFRIDPEDTAVKADGFRMVWPATNAAPSPLEAPKEFVSKATAVLRALIVPHAKPLPSPVSSTNTGPGSGPGPDTSVYVLAQLTQLLTPDCSTERPAVTRVLERLADEAEKKRDTYKDASWTFTAGYFNPDPSLTRLLLATGCARGNTVITASPQANGFYKSAGVSGLLPDAYTFLAHRFLRAVNQQGRSSAITLKEWQRGTVGQPGGWTYHAKGLWVNLPGSAGTLTLVGSSNYTKRSYSLDLEANALVVTRNPALQARLRDEQAWLQAHATAVTQDDFAQPSRRVRLHVRVAMWLVQLAGGQL